MAQHEAIKLIQAMQQELDSLRDQLAWSDRLSTLGEMSAALAHEFNNLMTPIGSYAQLALADLDDPAKTKKALEAAVQGVAQADQLVSAALGFASPSTKEKAEYTTLKDAVDQALHCVAIALDQDAISLDIQVKNESVAIDPLALQQVLVNLLRNAHQAMHGQQRPRKLTIRSEQGEGSATLMIADTGPGIPESIRDRLFEPFITRRHETATPGEWAGDQSSKQRGVTTVGNGLGLSICKRLIESAGGTISADSTPGQGSTFRLCLRTAQHKSG